MTVMDPSGAFRLLGRINTKEHINGFGPFRAVVGGIEQSHIELDMRAIILGEHVPDRCHVFERGNRGCHVEDRRRIRAAGAVR